MHSLLPNDPWLTIHAVLLNYQSGLFSVLLWTFSKFRTGRSEALLFFGQSFIYLFIYFLLYNIVLVLPYLNMNPPQVYTCSPSSTSLPPLSPYHPSGSFQCTSPKHPVSCIEPGLAIHFIYDIIHVSMPFSQIIPPSPSPTESCMRDSERDTEALL